MFGLTFINWVFPQTNFYKRVTTDPFLLLKGSSTLVKLLTHLDNNMHSKEYVLLSMALWIMLIYDEQHKDKGHCVTILLWLHFTKLIISKEIL